jgi:hypothetical protein
MMKVLTGVHHRVIEVFRKHPRGISINELRRELALSAEEQQHLDRRVRDLDAYFEIDRVRQGTATLYVLRGEWPHPKARAPISERLRAQIFLRAQNRCQMCGRSSAEDGVVLEIDHMKPVEWGGTSDESNLQALCRECNRGKKAFFATLDPKLMNQAFKQKKVHLRIAALLEGFYPDAVDSFLLGLVAGQEDWQKRLRELRTLNWKIAAKRKKGSLRVQTSYQLMKKGTSLSADPARQIRAIERSQKK